MFICCKIITLVTDLPGSECFNYFLSTSIRSHFISYSKLNIYCQSIYCPPPKKNKIIKLKKFLGGDVWRLRSPCNISKSKLNSWKKEEKDTVLILIATLATTEVSAGAVAKADQNRNYPLLCLSVAKGSARTRLEHIQNPGCFHEFWNKDDFHWCTIP